MEKKFRGQFESGNDPIKGFLGHDFLNFNIKADMARMDEEICLALATSNISYISTVGGTKAEKVEELNKLPFESEYAPEPMKGFDDQERRRYLIFKRKIDAPWSFRVDLKKSAGWHGRLRDTGDWSSVSKKTPYTKSVIESMPFKEIGAVWILGAWQGSGVSCHRDMPSTDKLDSIENHVNFNPGGYRPVYLYDPVEDKKRYLPKEYNFYAMNTTDFHGVDPLPHFSYTIRVNGIYKDEVFDLKWQ